jgi:hypothetical protein
VTERAGEVSRADCGTVIWMVTEKEKGSDIERVKWGVKKTHAEDSSKGG